MERLADSDGFGWWLLEILEQAGWFVYVTVPLGGQIDDQGTRGVLVVAAHDLLDDLDIRIAGRTVADCAPQLLTETSKYALKIANAERRRARAA